MATQPANHVRFSSSPSLPHPIAIRAAEKLHKLKNCIHAESSFPAMCGALESLADLFDSLQHLLGLPSLERLVHKRWIEEQLDGSLRLLDMDAAMSDCLAAAKALVVDLRSGLRKRGDDGHVSSRKKAQKEAANCSKSLKKMEDGLAIAAASGSEGDFIVLDRLMREAREMAAAVLRSLLNLIAIPVAQKHWSRRQSMVPKLLQLRIGGAAGVNGGGSAAVGLEALLSSAFDCVSGKDDGFGGFGLLQKTAHDQLSVVEAGIEGLEIGLRCLFRRLIQNRVALLNVLSF